MLYHFLYPLSDYFGPFNLFRYITFRAAYAGAFALLICLFLGPWVIRLIRRFELKPVIREELNEHHYEKSKTPTMGGILILGSILLALLLFADLTNRYIQLGIITILGLGLLGFVDDYLKVKRQRVRGLNKKMKLAGQVIIALLIGIVLYFFPMTLEIKSKTNFILFKNVILDFGVFYILLVVLVIVGSSNAVNLTDGIDGLAIGLLAIASAALTALIYAGGHIKIANYLNILYIAGCGEMTVFGLAILGAALGFLWFNAHPAQIFMGDTGSLSLGGALGLLAIVARQELLLILVGGVFVLEAVSVLVQIIYFHLTGGKRVFRMAPFHHHLELGGWRESQIVIRLWILSILFSLLAISSLKIR